MQDTINFDSGQSMLCQLLNLIPSDIFNNVVQSSKTNYYYKKMLAREHFLCLFYGTLTGKPTLREICKNIPLLGHRMGEWDIQHLPKKSTLGDANKNRCSDFFAQIYSGLYQHYKELLGHEFALPIGGEVDPDKVYVFDSTTISLFKEICKGAGRNPLKGQKKGGMKAFCRTKLSDGAPDFVCLKPASVNENTFLKYMDYAKHSILVFDMGFRNYHYLNEWTQSDIYYVSLLRDNSAYNVIENLPNEDPDIKSDQVIELSYKRDNVIRTVHQRLIVYKDPENGNTMHFLTNMFDKKPPTITRLYKNRWTIEVLFKQMKQNFELKYFLSDSENGIKSQIWMALILNLLFTVIHKKTKQNESFSTIVGVVAKSVASHVDIIIFFNNPLQYEHKWYVQNHEIMQPRLALGKINPG